MNSLHSVGGSLQVARSPSVWQIVLAPLFLSILTMAEASAGDSGTFEYTGNLGTGRYFHTATLLPNGKVLVAGGSSGFPGGTLLRSAELYDSASGTWTPTGSLAIARWVHTATLLPNGKVLVAGGEGDSGDLATAELYDPATGIWTTTGGLVAAHYYPTATLLPGGKVLVAGGLDAYDVAELYNPVSGIWSATGSLETGRGYFTATLLLGGEGLAAGGGGSTGGSLVTSELYDSATGSWLFTGSLGTSRYSHTATLLPSGKVLVAGGYNTSSSYLRSAELYDPAAGIWKATGFLGAARDHHTATLLANGKVLLAGGYYSGASIASAELYDPATGMWTTTGSLPFPIEAHTATLLPNGNVLVAGGFFGDFVPASSQAELYLGPPRPPALLNISTRLRVLADNNVLIGGFIITGTDQKDVLIRGIGPSLSGVGITLSDPTLELHQGSTIIATNDNWKTRQDGTSQQADIEATTIPLTNDLESAIRVTLSPGAYTAILAGKNGGTGVGLIEVYDLGQGANSNLANISTRGSVDTADNVMIGGFIVGGGAGTGVSRVLVRALGPSVPVPGSLADPTLELRDEGGSLIDSNDNWKLRSDGSSQQDEIEMTGLSPTNDLESAVVGTLPTGNYTVIVRGVSNTAGVGLVEVYTFRLIP